MSSVVMNVHTNIILHSKAKSSHKSTSKLQKLQNYRISIQIRLMC